MATKLKEFATTLVAVVEPETSARVVAQLMRRHHIGALVVVDALDKNKPVGIVTDRDLVLELMAEGLDPAVFTAGDIMSVDLVTASPEMDAMDAVQLMRKYRLRRLVITDTDGHLAGIVTLEDVLALMTRELADFAVDLGSARDRETRARATEVL
ncbi:MAG: CBS domain-containing protein [Rhodoferax sp.]|uniref:CBS domain-containing protein n=1 Tax=Rhodoferax sp. TaxID=50421 RepID=UPI0027314370|nr:CBS domain-containing protein [Rhodoferax sp.]MDP1529775.1 CBS domain-containing protein [Rhodoferax sp.]MDP1942876.1 CBS domain-containing protein [Rhodoferax sp.]MDP3864674.1 CBS domain-containing protein [Rhodoferax sp.]